jgi:hypothetical protein
MQWHELSFISEDARAKVPQQTPCMVTDVHEESPSSVVLHSHRCAADLSAGGVMGGAV